MVMELLKLVLENGSTVKWRDEIYNKRNKWFERQRKFSVLAIKNNKLGEAAIVSL